MAGGRAIPRSSQLRSLYYMLTVLTLITAGLYSALVAYFHVPQAVTYLGIGVLAAGLTLVAGQSLRLVRYARLSLALWRKPEGSVCSLRTLYDDWSTAALWLAFGSLLLIVGLLIEGIVLFIVFPTTLG